MTDKTFYIILDTENDGIYNKLTNSYETVNVNDESIMLTDNNILTELTTQNPLGNWVIVIDKFGKEISDSALMLKLNYDNITIEFKNKNGLYIFDDSNINQIVLDNIEEIIENGSFEPDYISYILESCEILHYDGDYKDFFIQKLNPDFESVDIFKSCLSIEAVQSWIVNNYNIVNVNDDVMIVIND